MQDLPLESGEQKGAFDESSKEDDDDDDDSSSKDKSEDDEEEGKVKNSEENKTSENTRTEESASLEFDEDPSTIENQMEVPTIVLARRQYKNFGLMALAYIFILITALLRGGEGKSSILNIESCSSESWGIFFLSQFSCIILAYFSFWVNKTEFERQDLEMETKDKNNGLQEEQNSNSKKCNKGLR